MRLAKAAAKTVGDMLGVHIVPKSNDGWPEEQFATALWKDLGVDCIFDVGANVGQYGRHLRRLGFEGTILSFEPGPEAFAALAAVSSADPRWHVFNEALGEEPGTLPFNVMASTAMSSFLRPSTQDGEPFSDVNVVTSTLDVVVSTLNDRYGALADRHGFRRPFLKLDTQGYDLHVVRGAGSRLGNFVGIVSEVSVRRLYVDAPMIVDSLQEFERRGFGLVGLFSVHPGNIVDPYEFNCYLVHSDVASPSQAAAVGSAE